MIAKLYPDGRYSVVSANGIYVMQLPRHAAVSALRARGLSEDRALAVLDRRVSNAEWVSTFVAAAAATALAAEESLSHAAEATDVENMRAELTSAVEEFRSEVAACQLREERARLEVQLAKRHEKLVATALSTGLAAGRDLDNAIWTQLFDATEAGRRLQELRGEL